MARSLPNLPTSLQNTRLDLPWGGQPYLRNIELEEESQTFWLGDFDVSEWIPEQWVHYWPGFDLEAFNEYLYLRRMDAEGRYVTELGPTGMVKAFLGGVWLDYKAIGDGLRRVYTTVAQVPQNIADTAELITKPLVLIGLGITAYLLFYKPTPKHA